LTAVDRPRYLEISSSSFFKVKAKHDAIEEKLNEAQRATTCLENLCDAFTTVKKMNEQMLAGRAAGAKVINNGGTADQVTEAAAAAAMEAGAQSGDTVARVCGEVAGAHVTASGGTKEDAAKAAAEIARRHGGTGEAQAAAASAAMVRSGGSEEDSGMAAMEVTAILVREAGLDVDTSTEVVERAGIAGKEVALADGGLDAAVHEAVHGRLINPNINRSITPLCKAKKPDNKTIKPHPELFPSRQVAQISSKSRHKDDKMGPEQHEAKLDKEYTLRLEKRCPSRCS